MDLLEDVLQYQVVGAVGWGWAAPLWGVPWDSAAGYQVENVVKDLCESRYGLLGLGEGTQLGQLQL